MAEQSAGRVSLHPCFQVRLWTASTEITGEGGTPALFLPPIRTGKEHVGNLSDRRKKVRHLSLVERKSVGRFSRQSAVLRQGRGFVIAMHGEKQYGGKCRVVLLQVGKVGESLMRIEPKTRQSVRMRRNSWSCYQGKAR